MTRSSRRGAIYAAGLSEFTPIDLGPDHVYWASGSEFQASSPTDGGTIQTWHDESGAADLTQATSANRPTYRASHVSFNSKPIVEFDGTNDLMVSGSFTQISQAFTMVAVFRLRAVNTGLNVTHRILGGSTTSEAHTGEKNGQWHILGNNNAVGKVGGTADTNTHLIRREVNNFANKVWVDEVLVINDATNLGTDTLDVFGVGARPDGARLASIDLALAAAFVGTLTAQEVSDLHTWSQDFYGTP